MRDASAHDPLTLIRHLYEAWNTGDVAGAAALLSPTVTWESFGPARPAAGPHGLQATLAGGSGGTWRLSPVSIDLLVQVGKHVVAFSRRSVAAGGDEAARLEVWTLGDGKAVHYRGYPLDEGLAVLSATTGDRKLEVLCRAALAFNRGHRDRWLEFFEADGRDFAARLGGRRLDDLRIVGSAFNALVISAIHRRDDASAAALHLAITFADDRARRVVAHPTPEAAVAGVG